MSAAGLPSPIDVDALLDEAFRRGFAPVLRVTTSEWADEHRILTRETSSEYGRWRTLRTPYLREPMDRLSPHDPTSRVVMMFGAQLAKSEAINNAIGQRLHQNPGPMMLVQPTVDVARNYSKERIGPLVSATPVIAERVLENRSRDGENTIFVKRVTGGFLKITGANSAASLRSTPIRDLFMDEVDAYPLDVDGEGDPVGLAEARTTNFPLGKKCYTSTPKLRHLSRIEHLYLQSDQRRYFVPCPHCGAFDHLRWSELKFDIADPSSAEMLCGTCGVLIEERYKTWMLERGEWRPTATGDGRTAGYTLNALYSPLGWLSWAELVREWKEAQGNVLLLKKFVNTRLAETWEEKAQSVDADTLLERREAYEHEVPDGVGVLVGAVDVQADRLEWKIVGYGAGEESWLIAAAAEMGDPAHDDVWLRLDEQLRRTWTHASGDELRVECVAVDAQFRSEQVYKFCKARAERRIYAVRGGNERGKPILGRPTTNNSFSARLYTLCVDSAKELILSRLGSVTPGPGYMHLPDWVDAEYLAQLTAEKAVRRFPRGRPSYIEWVKHRERNEALDLEVYCTAALRILYGSRPHKRLEAVAAKLSARAARAAAQSVDATTVAQAAPTPAVPRRKNWVTGGKPWSV